MIKSSLCVDCICLAVCICKSKNQLIEDCPFFVNTLINITHSIPVDDSLSIYFRDLHKTIKVVRTCSTLSIQITPTIGHILKFMKSPKDCGCCKDTPHCKNFLYGDFNVL